MWKAPPSVNPQSRNHFHALFTLGLAKGANINSKNKYTCHPVAEIKETR